MIIALPLQRVLLMLLCMLDNRNATTNHGDVGVGDDVAIVIDDVVCMGDVVVGCISVRVDNLRTVFFVADVDGENVGICL